MISPENQGVDFVPECTPTYRLEEYINEGKRDPVRWAELNREWEQRS